MKLNQAELLPIWNIAEAYLKDFASDADFVTKMQLAFGDSYDLDSATDFARDWIVGDFSSFPGLEVRPAAEINGANGAFASATNTIYLSQELITQNDESLIATVFLEEYGHYLDSQINVLDATGDEGQVFAALVQEEDLSQMELSVLQAEDDTATIILDNQVIQIEQQTEVESDFTVNEDAGSISFPLFGTASPDNTGPTDPAQYTLSLDEGSSTATPGEDFENLFPLDILFPGGVLPGETIETTTRIIIPIVNDDSSETDETIVLNPGNFINFIPFSDPVIIAIVDDDGIDLDPLRVGGNFEEVSDNRFEASGTIRIGRSDGLFPLLTLEGEASYNEETFSASGTFLSSIGNIQEPLFEGSIEIPIGTATATSFQDNGNSPEQFGLAGLDIDFSSLALTQNGMRLESQFSLPDEITGRFINISLSQPDALFISQNGPRIGVSGSIDFPEQQFSLFDLLNVNASDLAISYDAPQDAIKIQGKITVDSFTKSSDTEVVADLSGSNFIQVRDEDSDGDAEADIVGSLSVKNLDLPGGWGLSEATVTLDTINDSIGGDVKVTFPFASREIGVGLGLEFMPINPLELNRISAEVDGLQLAIGNTGAFLQSLSGGVNNLAPSNTDSIEFAGGVGITAGPEVFGRALAELNLSATISSERVTGMGQLTIVDSQIVNASGSVTLDWNQKFLSTNSNFSILDGLIQTENSFRTDPRFNINMAGSASVGIPNFLPFGGTRLGSGNFLLDFSNDSNLSNDFAAGWGSISNPLSFLPSQPDEFVVGIKGTFDGDIDFFGADEVPETSSFDVADGTEFLVLNVNWDNPESGNVPVRVIDEEGNIIEEVDFAANNIAIVDELTNETNKTVIIANPDPGVWDIEVVDDTRLGEVRFFATRDSEAPTIEVTAPAVDVTGPEITIEWDAFDANSDAEIKLFYDTDNEGFDGVLIADGLTETDGAGDFVWNTEGVPTGDYFIYAMVMDENNPPAFSYSTGTVQITEEADLLVTKTASADTVSVGEELIYTVTVTNNGTIDSTGVTLTDTLPDEVEFVSSSIAPSTQSDNTLTFEIDDLGSGESTTFEIAVTPTTTGTIANSASVTSNTFDPDATNDAIVLATTVTEPAPDLAVTVEDPGFVVTGNNFTYSITVTNNGPAQATGVTLTNNLPGAVNFVSATSSQGDVSDSGRIVTANLGDLDSGETTTVDILVTPIAADLLTNIVSVTSNEPDPDLTNNSIIQTTQVNAELLEEADLELTKTANNLTPNVGDLVTFTLTLANNGPGLASGIEVTDLLPPSLSFVSAEPDRGSYDEVTGIWSVADVQDGLSTSLAIAATIETIGTLINTAEISAVDQDDPDSTPNNNNPDEDDQASITLNSSSNLMLIEGTPGNDTLVGTEGNDSIAGLSGSDRLFGLSSDDVLNGGPDNDILDGGTGNDTVIGGSGRDTLIGGPNSDIFVLPTDTAAPDESQADVILAFQLNFLDPATPTDLIGLTGGLTEADLNLEPSNAFRQGTIIEDANTDRVLGVVANIPPDRLNGLFVSVDSGLF